MHYVGSTGWEIGLSGQGGVIGFQSKVFKKFSPPQPHYLCKITFCRLTICPAQIQFSCHWISQCEQIVALVKKIVMCHVSVLTYHVSYVTGHMSCVTCLMSLAPTGTARDPLPANSQLCIAGWCVKIQNNIISSDWSFLCKTYKLWNQCPLITFP